MAGYKRTVIDDDAVSLWTFDGDAFDSGTRKLIVPDGEPRYIIDEIDNLNPGILHCDNETHLGYRLGLPSLVSFEQTDQHAISFGFYGKQPSHPNQWGRAYIEVPHSISYAFPRFGSFAIEMLFNKQYGSDEGNSAWNSWSRPILSKSGVFNVYFEQGYYTPFYLRTVHPGGTAPPIDLGSFRGSSLINRTIHYVFTWEVIDTGGRKL